MSTDPVRHAGGRFGESPHPRKVRTSDCKRCLLLQSFRHAELPAATVNALCERMWLNRVRRRQLVYVEGNRATHFYAIRSGKVKLVRIAVSGREHITAILEAGDLFGFEAVFDDAYCSDAVTLTDAELCMVSGTELNELIAEVPRLMTDIARYLSFQLCRTRQRQACLTASSASAKLAAYLLQGLHHGSPGEEATVAGDLTLRDLAGVLGISPETVCRARRGLAERGIIETLSSGVRVRDVESLQRVAGH